MYLSLAKYEKQNQLKILVSDSGVGFDSEVTGKILPKENRSTLGTIGEKGFGLGLRVIQEIIESLNGNIKMTSKWGNGAVFEVTLPEPSIQRSPK